MKRGLSNVKEYINVTLDCAVTHCRMSQFTHLNEPKSNGLNGSCVFKVRMLNKLQNIMNLKKNDNLPTSSFKLQLEAI